MQRAVQRFPLSYIFCHYGHFGRGGVRGGVQGGGGGVWLSAVLISAWHNFKVQQRTVATSNNESHDMCQGFNACVVGAWVLCVAPSHSLRIKFVDGTEYHLMTIAFKKWTGMELEGARQFFGACNLLPIP